MLKKGAEGVAPIRVPGGSWYENFVLRRHVLTLRLLFSGSGVVWSVLAWHDGGDLGSGGGENVLLCIGNAFGGLISNCRSVELCCPEWLNKGVYYVCFFCFFLKPICKY